MLVFNKGYYYHIILHCYIPPYKFLNNLNNLMSVTQISEKISSQNSYDVIPLYFLNK